MIPRTFRLVNGNGESYDITSTTTFFHEPSGLGFSKSNSYHQVGRRYILVDSQPDQINVTGSIAFLGAYPYEQYFNFVSFLQITPLYLFYTPDPDVDPDYGKSGRTYRLPVEVASIDKSEILEEGYLDCSITFHGLSPWFRYVVISHEQGADPLIWGITWGIEFGSNGFAEGITSDGTIASPSRLTIYGPIVNPRWELYVNGAKQSDGAFNTTESNFTVAEGEKLVIDNTNVPFTVTLIKADGSMEDVYQKTDFSTSRFFYLSPGKNIVKITDKDGERYYKAQLEAYLYYDTV